MTSNFKILSTLIIIIGITVIGIGDNWEHNEPIAKRIESIKEK